MAAPSWRDGYSAEFPHAVCEPGGVHCLAWPTKNHGIKPADCRNPDSKSDEGLDERATAATPGASRASRAAAASSRTSASWAARQVLSGGPPVRVCKRALGILPSGGRGPSAESKSDARARARARAPGGRVCSSARDLRGPQLAAPQVLPGGPAVRLCQRALGVLPSGGEGPGAESQPGTGARAGARARASGGGLRGGVRDLREPQLAARQVLSAAGHAAAISGPDAPAGRPQPPRRRHSFLSAGPALVQVARAVRVARGGDVGVGHEDL
mmetsp:Transcript_14439/g.46235  ORF Transcript_14439/g.46235 Transcript_14439/m.46235 type:complete len:270 (+) Transcript_14439:241-1050(+)